VTHDGARFQDGNVTFDPARTGTLVEVLALDEVRTLRRLLSEAEVWIREEHDWTEIPGHGPDIPAPDSVDCRACEILRRIADAMA